MQCAAAAAIVLVLSMLHVVHIANGCFEFELRIYVLNIPEKWYDAHVLHGARTQTYFPFISIAYACEIRLRMYQQQQK